jgi:hypothetical protein
MVHQGVLPARRDARSRRKSTAYRKLVNLAEARGQSLSTLAEHLLEKRVVFADGDESEDKAAYQQWSLGFDPNTH